MVQVSERTTETFASLLQQKYPRVLGHLQEFDIHTFYNKLLRAGISWNISDQVGHTKENQTLNDFPAPVNAEPVTEKRNEHTQGCDAVLCSQILDWTCANSAANPLIRNRRDIEEPPFGEEDNPDFLDEDEHSFEEEVAHGIHKASVTILGLLVILVRTFVARTYFSSCSI